jgi:hypothetical protein
MSAYGVKPLLDSGDFTPLFFISVLLMSIGEEREFVAAFFKFWQAAFQALQRIAFRAVGVREKYIPRLCLQGSFANLFRRQRRAPGAKLIRIDIKKNFISNNTLSVVKVITTFTRN